jgi:hypothetical protein
MQEKGVVLENSRTLKLQEKESKNKVSSGQIQSNKDEI